jgi:hypothetical protein
VRAFLEGGALLRSSGQVARGLVCNQKGKVLVDNNGGNLTSPAARFRLARQFGYVEGRLARRSTANVLKLVVKVVLRG